MVRCDKVPYLVASQVSSGKGRRGRGRGGSRARYVPPRPGVDRLPLIKSYQEKLDRLAPIHTFDPAIFDGDDECPRKVCDLVLALAIAHNDLNDVSFAFELRHPYSNVDDDKTINKKRGLAGGVGLNLNKLRMSIVHELLVTVQNQLDAVNHPWFIRLLNTLHAKNKKYWLLVVDVALKRKARDDFSKILAECRDKVAFHYDARAIGISFRQRFAKHPDPPCFSPGNSASSSRFYFADATVEERLFPVGEESAMKKSLGTGSHEVYTALDHALFAIVTRFIGERGGAKLYTSTNSG